jgi:chemotaxis protein methyltransferase CheR
MTLAGAKLGVGADADFDYIRKLVADRAAIVLDDSKQYLVESRLLPLARSEGVTGLSGLVGRLRVRGPSDPLVTAVVEAMTTNETSFFRDPPVFETLRTSILPDLIAKRSAARRLRIWSAAASTGQEAYSVVMLLREHFPELSGWRVEVLGTDLSTAVLERPGSASTAASRWRAGCRPSGWGAGSGPREPTTSSTARSWTRSSSAP